MLHSRPCNLLRLTVLLAAVAVATPLDVAGQVTATWQSLGPIRYGMPVEELEATLGRELVDTDDRAPDVCEQVTVQVEGQPVRVMVVGDAVARVDIREPGVRTAAGAGVGDSPQYVMVRFPGIEASPNPTNDGQLLTATSPDGTEPEVRIVFETLVGQVMAYRIGLMPAVSWIDGCP